MATIDHLIVAATSLDEGIAWCERHLGIRPLPGGVHTRYGTHNHLLRLNSVAHPKAYLEIIAIDPSAEYFSDARLRRWFDLDSPLLQEQLRLEGPQLIHWVASVPVISQAAEDWRQLGIEVGPSVEASRASQAGMLRWSITVRDDGQRPFAGVVPTLIEWGDLHPSESLNRSPITLVSLSLQHPEPLKIRDALALIGIDDVMVSAGPAALLADFMLEDGSIACIKHVDLM
jgi:hypothetical protein